MAKNKTAPVATANVSEVDDLLGDGPQTTNDAPQADVKVSDEAKEEKAPKTAEELEIEAKIKELQQLIKAEKAKLKGDAAPKERTLKGQMVAFKNKKGEQIVGMGSLYYVARFEGKLHYKEASQVVVLPEGWKEGDAIPELPAKEVPATEEAAA